MMMVDISDQNNAFQTANFVFILENIFQINDFIDNTSSVLIWFTYMSFLPQINNKGRIIFW